MATVGNPPFVLSHSKVACVSHHVPPGPADLEQPLPMHILYDLCYL